MASLTETLPLKNRSFVSSEFVVTDWAALEPYYKQLLDAELPTLSDLEQWLMHASELDFVVNEDKAWRYIRMTCDTENTEIKERFQYFVREIMPHLSRMGNALLKKMYSHPLFAELDPHKYEILVRAVRNRIELYQEDNVALQSKIRQRAQQFDEILGGMSVEDKGEKLTLQQAASLLEDLDRGRREEIWRKLAGARFDAREALGTLYSELADMRHEIAQNASLKTFADFKFKELGRFDYDRSACAEFHNAIEKVVKPLYVQQNKRRRDLLGLDDLRPWDVAVDVFGEGQLKPFSNTKELVGVATNMLDRLDPSLGNQLRDMQSMGHLDLESRLGKAPGGYNYSLPESGVPFIFMNAVGTQGDLTTMLHEAGHAVHSFATRDIRLSEFQRLPSEVAELAAMSMELLTIDFLDEVYDDPRKRLRAKREQLLRPINLLPWIASIDAFQFWVYDNPGHSVEERNNSWIEIYRRFHGEYMNWSGLEEIMQFFWQKQGHIYDMPFYYIEYGIAQLGAIAVWRNYKQNPQKGLQDYLNALSMGYTRPIPEIYEAAGIRFDFSEDYIHELLGFLHSELEEVEVALGMR